jgi:hypothetical protein
MPKPAPDSASIANEIELSLVRILDRLASTVRIDGQFSEGGHAVRQTGRNVSLTNTLSVVAGVTG